MLMNYLVLTYTIVTVLDSLSVEVGHRRAIFTQSFLLVYSQIYFEVFPHNYRIDCI
jgi:hypothetical protein